MYIENVNVWQILAKLTRNYCGVFTEPLAALESQAEDPQFRFIILQKAESMPVLSLLLPNIHFLIALSCIYTQISSY